jgi:hypothetical protein
MNFAEAYKAMTEGKKVRRPGFKGYWAINPEDGQPYIHLADGKDISYGKLGITMKNAAATDWEVVSE